jgi:hypothetical protein
MRNMIRAIWFEIIIGAMCLVSIYTLAYISQFITPETIHALLPSVSPLFCSIGGWLFLGAFGLLFARKIVRTVVG